MEVGTIFSRTGLNAAAAAHVNWR